MAFVPLFIDPSTSPGLVTFAAMAGTIAALTVLYCVALCAIASRLAGRLKADRRIGRWLERAAGAVILAFGLRLLRD
jgi:threonine/homoserine/homoserine lactone efflux protein